MKNRLCVMFSMLCGLLALSVGAFGQATGSIHGTVSDASGAVVPEARLTVTNVGTNQSRELTAGENGQYSVPFLSVGNYTVRIEKEGFKPFLQTGVVVQVDTNVQVNAALEVRTAQSEVTVNATAALVQSATTNLVQVIDQQRVQDLPLNGRVVLALTMLDAGVVPGITTSVVQTQTVGKGDYNVPTSVNGARANQGNYLLDNVDHNDNYTNVNNPYPNPDAVQEFSVQTSTFDAQYGRGMSSIVNVVTKSGTNQLHGSAFEYIRNYALNARNFFTGRDFLKRNQFGFTLGGPISIPKVYNGKDRTFFFGSYQGTRRQLATPGLATTPSQAMKQGDLSAYLGANGVGAIHDPLAPGQYFPNNQIPVNRFDPVSAKYVQFMPSSSDPSYQYRYSTPSSPLSDNQVLTRIDHNISSSHRISGRYFGFFYDLPWVWMPTNLYFLINGATQTVHSAGFTDTYVISDHSLNEFNVGFQRQHAQGTTPSGLSSCCTMSALGARIGSDPRGDETTALSISNWSSFGRSVTENTFGTNYEVSDNFTFMFGKHELRFGGDAQRYRMDYSNNWMSAGSVSFSGQLSSDSGKSNAGTAFADFLLGQMASWRQQNISVMRLYNTFFSAYVQDDIKLTPKLTLNLGMRWDPKFYPTDAYHQRATFVPGVKSVMYPNAPLGLLFYGDSGVGDPVLPGDWNNLAPRVGIAYQLHPGTVIRAAYGVFYDQYMMISNNRTAQAPPYVDQLLLTNSGQFSNPNGNDPVLSVIPRRPTTNVAFLPYATYAAPSTRLHAGNMQNWNFVFERQISSSILVRAAYVGSKGTHLLIAAETNPAIYGPGATAQNANARRVYNNIGLLQLGLPDGWSKYQSLQLTLQKRLSHGLMVMANYTNAKSIDIASYGTIESNNIGPDAFNWNKNRGPSDFDVPQRLVVSGVWQLPGLKGQNRLLRGVAGGWQSNFIYTAQAGIPLNVLSGVDNALSTVGGEFADLTGVSWRLPDDRSKGDKILHWFDSAAFKANASGTNGTGGRNQLRQPGLWNLDYSLFKEFSFRERGKLQFRGEAFNVLNHANLGTPTATSVSSSTFGRITTAKDPRIIQLGLKFLF